MALQMKNLDLNKKFFKIKKNSIFFPLLSNFLSAIFGIFFFGSILSLFFLNNYSNIWIFVVFYFILFLLFFNIFLVMNNKYLILAKHYELKTMEQYLKIQRFFGIFSIFNYFSRKNEIKNEYKAKYFLKINQELSKNSIDKSLVIKLFFIHKIYQYISLPFSIVVFISVFLKSEMTNSGFLINLSESEINIYFFIIPIIFCYLILVVGQIIYFTKNKNYISKVGYTMSYIPLVNVFAGAFI